MKKFVWVPSLPSFLEEMRHIKFFLGADSWGFGWGAKKFMLQKCMCIFCPSLTSYLQTKNQDLFPTSRGISLNLRAHLHFLLISPCSFQTHEGNPICYRCLSRSGPKPAKRLEKFLEISLKRLKSLAKAPKSYFTGLSGGSRKHRIQKKFSDFFRILGLD